MIRSLVFAVLALFVGATAIAQSKTLIIQTPEGPVEVPLDDASNVNLLSNGDISATSTSDFNVGGYDDVLVDISSFTVNGSQSANIPQGNSATFRWSSRGAWTCEGGGLTGWTGTGKPPSNTSGQTVSTADIPLGTYEASLLCSNGAEAGSTVSITIEEADSTDPLPAGCETRRLPSDWSRRTTGTNSCIYKKAQEGSGLDMDADCSSVAGVWGDDWPIGGVTKVLTLGGRNGGKEFVAMEFTTSTIPADLLAQISVSEPQAGGLEPNEKIWTIAKCPGDFDKARVENEMGEGCYMKDTASATQAFSWGGLDAVSSRYRCGLESNTRYYLNIMYSDSPAGTPPSQLQPHPNCTNQACGNRLSDTADRL